MSCLGDELPPVLYSSHICVYFHVLISCLSLIISHEISPCVMDTKFYYNSQFSFDINVPLSTVNCTAFLMENHII